MKDSIVATQEGKLEPSEELGDLFKGAGDNATALACYQTAGSTTKVVEGEQPPEPLSRLL